MRRRMVAWFAALMTRLTCAQQYHAFASNFGGMHSKVDISYVSGAAVINEPVRASIARAWYVRLYVVFYECGIGRRARLPFLVICSINGGQTDLGHIHHQ